MGLISLIINCDNRSGSADDDTHIGKFATDQLHGCRSYDFMTHGIIMAQNFFNGYDIETVLCVDEHAPIPQFVLEAWDGLTQTGRLQKLIVKPVDRTRYRWNDALYNDSLRLAGSRYVCHLDQDTALFRQLNCDIVAQYLRWLDSGFKYICQPHNGGDMMWHASTRFFICKRETLDFPEIERCLDQNYVNRKYGKEWWCPCAEHVLGLLAGPGKVLYPPLQPDDYLIWSWVKYYKGLLPQLNQMTYEQVRDYAMDCGLHGPMDLIAKPL